MDWYTLLPESLLTVAVFLGNILILIAVKRGQLIKKTTYIGIAFLAVSDIVSGSTIFLRNILAGIINIWQCKLILFFFMISIFASTAQMFIMSVELLIAVKYLKSTKKVWTPRHSIISAVCILLVSILLSSLDWILAEPVEDLTSYEPVCTSINPTIFNQNAYFAHCSLVLVVNIFTTISFIGVLILGIKMNSIEDSSNNSAAMKQTKARYNRLTKVVLLIWITYAVTTLPLLTIFQIMRLGLAPISITVVQVLGILYFINSALNVVIYAVKCTDLRVEFKKFLTPKCFRKAQLGQDSSVQPQTLTTRVSKATENEK